MNFFILLASLFVLGTLYSIMWKEDPLTTTIVTIVAIGMTYLTKNNS